MKFRHLFLLLALATSGAGVAQTDADPHGHAAKQRSALSMQNDPMAPVYVVASRATFEGSLRTYATDPAAVRDRVGRDLVVSRVRAHQLDDISQSIHERERRCGGYFAFATREAAETFVRRDRTAQAMNTKALAAYTLDNQRTVQPWLAQVQEPRIRATIAHLESYPNRYYTTNHGLASAVWIRDTWLALGAGRSDVSAELFSCAGCGTQPSVILTVRGSELPDEIVVVGGHLDSISNTSIGGVMEAPGADDDASGIATITEVIRIALANGWKPKRTVKFMGYAAEEVGLRGSTAIAQAFRNQNANVVGVLQLDMTNYAAGATVSMRLISDFSSSTLKEFVIQLFDHYLAPSGLTRGSSSCGYACSDHASWTAAGYPSAFMMEPTLFPYRHTPADNLQEIGPTAGPSVNLTKLALAFVGELAKTSATAPADFDGDLRSDVFWRNTANGANDIWRSALAAQRQPASPVSNLAWQAVGLGDVNGDGRGDVVWRNASSGANDIWLSASSQTRQPISADANVAWKIVALGDFDGDGRDDLFWRNTGTGAVRVWPAANAAAAQARVTVADANWQVAGVGDFDLDGRDDVLWRNGATGANDLWRSGTSQQRQSLTAVTNLAWTVAGVGDFNGDRRADIFWRNTGTGANVLWLSGNAATQQTLSTVADGQWRVAAVGDYTGDGRSDVFWRHATLGYNELWPSASSAQRVPLARVSNLDWKVVR